MDEGSSIAAEIVAQRNAAREALKTRIDRELGISAAWEVWGEAQHTVRRLTRQNEWSGDLPDAAQRAQCQEQFNAQIFEAYARARLQCAIVLAVDDVDMARDFDAHWEETWGAVITTRAAAAYGDRYASALERQQAGRAAAQAQTAALEAAGV